MAKYGVNFTEGSVVKNHLRFALPLMATSSLQLMYNMADQVVVGRWTGSNALAAIGATASLYGLMINFFMGLSVGAGIIIARKYGAKDMLGLNKTAHSAVGMSFVVGIMAMILGLVFCKPLLKLTGIPESVIELSTLYMKILLVGAPFMMVYNFGAAILRSVGDTKRPLYILSATGIVNVALNLLLVIVFHMGVAGVAIATITANFLSAAAVLYMLVNSDAPYQINPKNIKIRKNDCLDFIKIGLPAGIQSVMYNFSNVILQGSINTFGTTVMAATASAGGIESFIYVALNSFTQSTLTSVGQNYGAGNKKRMYKTLWMGIVLTTITGIFISSMILLFSKQLLGLYIADNPEAIKIGVIKMFITTTPYFLLGIMEQFGSFLNGVGKVMQSALNSFLGTCVFRIIWVVAVLPFFPNYYLLNAVYPASWIITLILHCIMLLILRKKIFSVFETQ